MNRKLVTTLFYSVDGRANRPDTFQFDAFDQELAQLMTESIGRIDDVVLGRNSYNEWSSYWPAVTEGPMRDSPILLIPPQSTWPARHYSLKILRGLIPNLFTMTS
ncbi:Dihydrofolate reductase [Corynebacterium pseudotuberculosis]|nr:Dihydrofolate reductase [Corynebacterium pseudotuberculosis]QBB99730.1 Dihydrofolate reductase [Corynebacterium pseudotuberculosis]QBI73261.1 Dihydrofolate reductase [Corynebacterium pseudotuberculosis]QBK60777.1 Dihydrofolate reductase [Corynebacterium pseudotuberculosis]QBS29633.1 Dihydrofolate reductase [Corynebacterium pseudotuberculosis]